jgi:TonB-linked SusC/RagA family outer membrane protein
MKTRLLVTSWASVILAITAAPAPAQTGTVTGRVVDSHTLQPLSSAQVFIAELSIGTLTRDDGRYLLVNVPAGTHRLQAQIIGYRTASTQVSVTAGAQSAVDVLLSQDALALDEVVVTGTPGGTQRRALGNVVGRVNADAVGAVSPASNVEELIGSKVPGLVIQATSGTVGAAGAPIRIRGVSSPGVSNDPIIFVDGVRMNSSLSRLYYGTSSRLNDINPNDIESIEVIKGPAAATLYGTEAANGVIQIITKKGSAGTPQFDASFEVGANWFPNPEGTVPLTWATDPQTREVYSHNLYTAWRERTGEDLFQKGPITRANVSVRGGTEFIRYFGSLNRGQQEGFVAWNTDVQNSGRASLTIAPSEKINLTLNGSYITGETRLAGNDIWGTFLESNANNRDGPSFGFFVPPNILGSEKFEEIFVDRSMWSGQLEFRPLTWLTSRLVAGTDFTNQTNSDFLRRQDLVTGFFQNNNAGYRQLDTFETRVNTVDASATARFQLSPSVASATSVGFQYYDQSRVLKGTRGEGFISPQLSTVSAAQTRNAVEAWEQQISAGAFVQQQVELNNRLFLTAAVRGDDHSAFGSEFDAAIYPKASIAWVVSEEAFFRAPLLDELRVRGAWGAAGRQPGTFAATRLYAPENGRTGVVLTPKTIGNPELGPERSEELEVGFDAALLDQRLSLEFTQYWKRTTDAIIDQNLSPSFGFPGTQSLNVGQVSNWGTELGAAFQILRGRALAWELGAAVATMNNRVDELGGSLERIAVGEDQVGLYHVEGFPLASFFHKKVVSAEFISGNSGAVKNVMCDAGSEPISATLAGGIGGVAVPCDEAPLIFWGRSGQPAWSLNLNSSLTLQRNWRLYASADGVGGHRQVDQEIAARHTTWATAEEFHRKENAIAQAYMAQQNGVSRNPIGSYRAGFLRLRELSLQYTIPDAFAGRLGLDRASVKLAGRNLGWLWKEQPASDVVNVPVTDPERRLTGSLHGFSGHVHKNIPTYSTGTLEVKVGF